MSRLRERAVTLGEKKGPSTSALSITLVTQHGTLGVSEFALAAHSTSLILLSPVSPHTLQDRGIAAGINPIGFPTRRRQGVDNEPSRGTSSTVIWQGKAWLRSRAHGNDVDSLTRDLVVLEASIVRCAFGMCRGERLE